MRIGLLADIHGNVAALEAALGALSRQRPDVILSLGDQVNLGPCPRETLAMLRAYDVFLLQGNHERYILSAMDGDPAYDGANFESLRFHAALLTREDLTFPVQIEMEGIHFCHAMPDDPFFPIGQPELALPRLRALQVHEPLHVVCGHGHNPTFYRLPNLSVDCIGSVGCMDDGAPGVTNFAVLDTSHGPSAIRLQSTAYDTRVLRGQFKSGGMADACPVMARLALLQMEQNHDVLSAFVDAARKLSSEKGETCLSMRTWHEADECFDWPDGLRTAEYWRA